MPVLVGVGQWSERRDDPADAASPIEILATVARRAADDADAGKALLESLDTLALSAVIGWPMRDAPAVLAGALGIAPRRRIETLVGGNGPLALVNRLAREIHAGACDTALVAGCDVFFSMLRARKRGAKLAWPTGAEGPGHRRSESWGEDRPALLGAEKRHFLVSPAMVYPLFENAWRARRGWSLAEHRRRLGALLAPMTDVAAENPYAWFPVRRSADEITTATPENRMVSFPYTCFPSAVQLARDALGIDDGDPRPVTLTGGLPYAGGPGNAYTLHALACATERLRAESRAKALCTGVGWFLSKLSATVLSSAPRPTSAPAIGSVTAAATGVPEAPPVPLADAAEGPATVETYTVHFDRSGIPTRGIVFARLPDGRRTVANTPAEPALLTAFAAEEQVGRGDRLRTDDGRNIFDPS